MPVTIVLADDHAIVRLGIRAALEAEPDFELVGEASDGREVVPLVERLQPDVLVLDLVMPGLHGLEIVRQLAQRVPHTRVVVLSMYSNDAYVATALQSGAIAYVLKGSHAREIVEAVRSAVAGRRYLGSPLSQRSVEVYLQQSESAPVDKYDSLTTREREVFQLVAEGHTSSAIASRLFISTRTVETHRAKLMHKLGLRTQTDLIRYAIRRGILPPDC